MGARRNKGRFGSIGILIKLHYWNREDILLLMAGHINCSRQVSWKAGGLQRRRTLKCLYIRSFITSSSGPFFTRGGFLRKKSASARFRNESTHNTERKQPLIMWELQRKCIFIEKKLQKDLVESEKSSTFALAFKNDAWLIRLRIRLEGWVSGWNQQFAKLPCGLPYRGFESPTFRKLSSENVPLVDSSNG